MIASPWVLAFQAEATPMWNSVVLGVLAWFRLGHLAR
jgi:hypothetical protein